MKQDLRKQMFVEPSMVGLPARLSLAVLDGDLIAGTDRWIIAKIPLAGMYAADWPASSRDRSTAVRVSWLAPYPAQDGARQITQSYGGHQMTEYAGDAGDPRELRNRLIGKGSDAAMEYLVQLHPDIFGDTDGPDLVEVLGNGLQVVRLPAHDVAPVPVRA
jgi:hypothetical protein